jgi:hypothetical protein
MKNVSMWYQKKPIPQLSIFCLIQSINNYVQINTYWRYIVRIMASNILLLASNFFFLTSQELVGTFKRLSSDKFSFARNIWACLSANITIHNVVIGIINQLQWATKTMTSRRLGIYTFQLQNPNLHQYFGLCFHQSYIRQASFVDLTGLFLVRKMFQCGIRKNPSSSKYLLPHSEH